MKYFLEEKPKKNIFVVEKHISIKTRNADSEVWLPNEAERVTLLNFYSHFKIKQQ